MKKRIYLVLTLLLAFLLVPKDIKAFTGSLSIECQSNVVKPGGTITCNLNANTSDAISAISIPFSSTNAEVLSFKSSDLWVFPDDIGNGQIDQTVKDTKLNDAVGNFLVGTFTIKINDGATGTATLTVGESKFYGADDSKNMIPASTKTLEINANPTSTDSGNSADNSQNTATEKKDDAKNDGNTSDGDTDVTSTETTGASHAYLSDIQIQGYTIPFREEVFTYNLKIKNEKVLSITPTMKYTDAFYNILGNQDLEDGSVISIKVTDKARNTNEYYINISKKSSANIGTNILIAICILLIFINLWRILKKRK